MLTKQNLGIKEDNKMTNTNTKTQEYKIKYNMKSEKIINEYHEMKAILDEVRALYVAQNKEDRRSIA